MAEYSTLIVEIIGWIAAILILAAYGLLTSGRLGPQSRAFQWMNVAGAAGFIVNSGVNGAYPSAMLNIVWMLIGGVALWRIRKRGSSTSAT